MSIVRVIYGKFDALRSDRSNACVRVQHKSVRFGEFYDTRQGGHKARARQYLCPSESDSLRSPVLEAGLVISIAGRRVELAVVVIWNRKLPFLTTVGTNSKTRFNTQCVRVTVKWDSTSKE
jgi:hypothetical protein